jgi:3-deoxy-D-manno-octulosonate 8-phosphate phosphatase KdsC-like HAD superfamily phosphatase
MRVSYKVELTGHTRYFAVTAEDGMEFFVVQTCDEGSDIPNWEVMDEKGQCVGKEQVHELIEAVAAYIKQKEGGER